MTHKTVKDWHLITTIDSDGWTKTFIDGLEVHAIKHGESIKLSHWVRKKDNELVIVPEEEAVERIFE